MMAEAPAAIDANAIAGPRFAVLPPLALYVHIPWCLRKCPYCDFNSHAWRPAGGSGAGVPSEDAEDGYVSGLHCRLGVGPDNTISLTDLGSSNGSFVRLREEHPVSSGDILLMGQQLFRIDA